VVVVDLQADFTEARQGSLAVPGADEAYLTRVRATLTGFRELGLPILATQDWHPADHVSFAANHPGRRPFEVLKLPDGSDQILWPAHCVQGSPGAELLIDPADLSRVIRKGPDRDHDSYSGFRDDGGAETGLEAALREFGPKRLIVFGLATDFCVKATVLHGLEAGFRVAVVQELCRGVSPEGTERAWQEMARSGAEIWPSLDLPGRGVEAN